MSPSFQPDSPARLKAPPRASTPSAQKLQVSNESKAVDLEHKARVATGADTSTSVLVVIQELHPNPEALLPFELILQRPAIEVRAMAATLRLEVIPSGAIGIFFMPFRSPSAHDISISVINVHCWNERMACLQKSIQDIVPLPAARLGHLQKNPASSGEVDEFRVSYGAIRDKLEAVFVTRVGIAFDHGSAVDAIP